MASGQPMVTRYRLLRERGGSGAIELTLFGGREVRLGGRGVSVGFVTGHAAQRLLLDDGRVDLLVQDLGRIAGESRRGEAGREQRGGESNLGVQLRHCSNSFWQDD